MEELEKMVNNLLEVKSEKVITELQKIGDKLVGEYIIRFGNIKIEPLWIEAYYYNEAQNFKDETCHKKDEQKNNLYKLYFHHKKGDRRSGVDICLSNGDFYLSYLLKYSLVNDIFTTQSQLHNKIYDEYFANNETVILEHRNMLNDDIICHAERIGLSQKEYYKEKIASVRGIDKTYVKNSNLPNREKLLIEYVKNNPEKHRNIDVIEYFTKILGYCPKEIKELNK